MIPSLKKQIIQNLACVPRLEGLEKNKLILATAAGFIAGHPCIDSCKKGDDFSEFLFNLLGECTDEYCKEFSLERPLSEDDGYLVLTDVTIRQGSTVTNMSNLVVFYDQIIGVSVGDLN